jgi:transcriptional regulator with XRE-family HTH domain
VATARTSSGSGRSAVCRSGSASVLWFEEPQAIYKWQRGKSLPSVDNLYALGALLDVPLDEILVSARPQLNMIVLEQQADACCSAIYLDRLFWVRQKSEIASTIYSDACA